MTDHSIKIGVAELLSTGELVLILSFVTDSECGDCLSVHPKTIEIYITPKNAEMVKAHIDECLKTIAEESKLTVH